MITLKINHIRLNPKSNVHSLGINDSQGISSLLLLTIYRKKPVSDIFIAYINISKKEKKSKKNRFLFKLYFFHFIQYKIVIKIIIHEDESVLEDIKFTVNF